MRPLFLKLFPHSTELGKLEHQLYSLFAFLLLREEFSLEAGEARHALTVGSAEGRAQVAWYWWRQADSATDYGATLFRDRLKYLLTIVWPLELDLKDNATSEHLAHLALCCGAEFEDAVKTITPLLTRVTNPHMVLFSLGEKDHAEKYPEATLELVHALIGEGVRPWLLQDVRKLLTRISAAEHRLTEDRRFIRLDAFVRQFE